MIFGSKVGKEYTINPLNYFPTISVTGSQSTNVTDGRSDGRTTSHGNTGLCTASRGKNLYYTPVLEGGLSGLRFSWRWLSVLRFRWTTFWQNQPQWST